MTSVTEKLIDMVEGGLDIKVIAEACNYISLLEHRLEGVGFALSSELEEVQIMTDEEMGL